MKANKNNATYVEEPFVQEAEDGTWGEYQTTLITEPRQILLNADTSNTAAISDYNTTIQSGEELIIINTENPEGLVVTAGVTTEVDAPTGNMIDSLDPFGDTSLMAKYKFNDDALDVLGLNNGTWIGTPSYVPGKFSNAAYFNATKIQTAYDFAGMTAFTISFWANSDNLTGDKCILASTGENHMLVFNDDPEGMRIVFYNDSSQILGNLYLSESISTTVLKYYTFSWVSGSEIKGYINGIPDTTSSIISGSINATVGTDMFIGNTSGDDRAFTGVIDQLEIYDRALSDAEVTALYNQTESAVGMVSSVNPFGDGSLLAKYKFDDDIIDATGNTTAVIEAGSETYLPGQYNNAFSIAGTNKVVASGLTLTANASVSLWLKWDSFTHNYGSFSFNYGNKFLIGYDTNTRSGTFALVGDQAHATGFNALNTGQWYHFVMVVDNDNSLTKVYLDGTEVSSIAGNFSSGNTDAYIAGVGYTAEASTIDQVEFYNKALSPVEVTALFEQTDSAGVSMVSSTNPFGDGSLTSKFELDVDVSDTTGTHNGTPTDVTFTTGSLGKFTDAAIFNGTTSNLDLGYSPMAASGGFAASFWIKFDGDADYCYIFENTSVTQNEAGIYAIINDTNEEFYWNATNGGSYGENIVMPYIASEYGVWTHFVISWDGTTGTNTAKIYKNGSTIVTGTQTVTQAQANQNGIIGSRNAEKFAGKMDQLEFFNRALTDEEVLALFEQTSTTGIAYSTDLTGASLVSKPTSMFKNTPNPKVYTCLEDTSERCINLPVEDFVIHGNTTNNALVSETEIFTGDTYFIGDKRVNLGVVTDTSTDFTNTADILGDSSNTSFFKFNDDATDSSTYNHSAVANSVTYGVGKQDNAVIFEGTDTSNVDTNYTISGTYTLSLWVKFLAGSYSNTRFTTMTVDGSIDVLSWYSDVVGWTVNGINVVTADDSSSILDSQWHHMLVDSSGAFYIDGVAQSGATNISLDRGASTTGLVIGGGYTSQGTNCSVDNLRTFNKLLSADEKLKVYTEGITTSFTADISSLSLGSAPTSVKKIGGSDLTVSTGSGTAVTGTHANNGVIAVGDDVLVQTGAVTDTRSTLDILGDASCIAAYNFDSDVTDLSGSYNATASAVTYGIGKFDNAVILNGNGDYIESAATNIKTVSLWFYATAFASSKYIVDARLGSGTAYTYLGDTGILQYADCTIKIDKVTYLGEVLALDTWYFLEMEITTATASTSIGSRYQRDTAQTFTGSIDQVRFFNRSLTLGEGTVIYEEIVDTLSGYKQVQVSAVTEDSTIVTTGLNTEFQTVTWTGNDSTQNIPTTNISGGVDFVWAKGRTYAGHNSILDSIRGITSFLITNSSSAEADKTEFEAFNADSFDISRNASFQYLNELNEEYIAWCTSLPTDVTNTTGTLTTTIKKNSFMSAISFIGNGVDGATIGHSLSGIPEMIIMKKAVNTSAGNTGNWITQHKDLPGAPTADADIITLSNANTLGSLNLNTDALAGSYLFDNQINGNTDEHIVYAFKSEPGVCKVGGYTGSATNFSVDLGFTPSTIIIKKTTGTISSWITLDDVMPDNATRADSELAQGAGWDNLYDFTTSGIDFLNEQSEINVDGESFVYIAFAKAESILDTPQFACTVPDQTENITGIKVLDRSIPDAEESWLMNGFKKEVTMVKLPGDGRALNRKIVAQSGDVISAPFVTQVNKNGVVV